MTFSLFEPPFLRSCFKSRGSKRSRFIGFKKASKEIKVKKMIVKEFLDSLSHSLEVPLVEINSSLKDVAKAMVKGLRNRIVYVVNSDRKLLGFISVDNLKDVIFRYHLNGRLSDIIVVTEHLEEIFISETAEDIMETGVTVCYENEKLGEVITRMVAHNVKDMPVIDLKRRVIANLDILDILELWLKKGEIF